MDPFPDDVPTEVPDNDFAEPLAAADAEQAEPQIAADPFFTDEPVAEESGGFEHDAVVIANDDNMNGLTDQMEHLGVEGSNGMERSYSPVMPRIEPETIRIWKEKHTALLEEKDQLESKSMNELKEKAQKVMSSNLSKRKLFFTSFF